MIKVLSANAAKNGMNKALRTKMRKANVKKLHPSELKPIRQRKEYLHYTYWNVIES